MGAISAMPLFPIDAFMLFDIINLEVYHLNVYVTRERIHCYQGCHAGCHSQVAVATVVMDTNS